MTYETIRLLPFEQATLTPICVVPTGDLVFPPRRAVIVCPGGGYRALSAREAEPIAMQFLARGYQTFILRYTVGEGAKDYAPLKQIALAIKYVRDNAEKYCVDPQYVFTCGFSAGGHLAASAGVLWNSPALAEILADRPEGYCRPTGMILSYPVVTAGPLAHQGSVHNLCGTTEPTDAQRDLFSLEKHVDATTPPAFIWHTFTDKTVPVQNSLMLAAAMRDAGVPFELHIYPEGVHGLSLCNEWTSIGKAANIVPHAQGWIEQALCWLRDFNL